MTLDERSQNKISSIIRQARNSTSQPSAGFKTRVLREWNLENEKKPISAIQWLLSFKPIIFSSLALAAVGGGIYIFRHFAQQSEKTNPINPIQLQTATRTDLDTIKTSPTPHVSTLSEDSQTEKNTQSRILKDPPSTKDQSTSFNHSAIAPNNKTLSTNKTIPPASGNTTSEAPSDSNVTKAANNNEALIENPKGPFNLFAEILNGEVQLTWNYIKQEKKALEFLIESRHSENEPFQELSRVNAQIFNFKTTAPSQPYTLYRVTAVFNDTKHSLSLPSNEAVLDINAKMERPTLTQFKISTDNKGDGRWVKINWKKTQALGNQIIVEENTGPGWRTTEIIPSQMDSFSFTININYRIAVRIRTKNFKGDISEPSNPLVYCPGDHNGDNIVQDVDLNPLWDANYDGVIDEKDSTFLSLNKDKDCNKLLR